MTSKFKDAGRRALATRGKVFALTVMAGLVSNAWAQTAPAEAAGEKGEKVMPSVVVTGYRSSLALSAAEKRDNIGLSDTVFSEDMGKFPDPNIADALARIRA